ncbi:Phox homologous domain-containing protein [Clohesyomyces aquaticus]|uniref:Phox homologous domain-containing protein n=1 Tax=Clohesyomyces aquaticus TaxID=1231657 RepID=A0A1Y1ZXA2_9PLEO|nr:Phox homologous domain-containing protein [Clohesyomyces aquaticus]
MAPLRITIPTAHDPSTSGKPYTTYEIRIAHPFPRGTTVLQKRYSDFCTLDSTLRSTVGTAPPTPLPPKSWLGGSLGGLIGLGSTSGSPEHISKRRKGLEAYLQAIETSEDGRWRLSPAYRSFLQLSDKEDKAKGFPGSQFGKDRVADSSDWLDKFALLKSQLQDSRLWLTRREQASLATQQHEASANAKRNLLRAGALISALEEGLERFSGKAPGSGDEWSGEKLGDGEVRRRRDMISSARKERDGLESVLNTMAVKSATTSGASTPSTSSAAVTAEQKAGLFKGAATAAPASGRRVLGAPAKETERTRELDNEGVLQLQKQIMAEQDEDLMDLTKVVRRMREMGVQINEEVVLQNQMLGLLEEDAGRVDGKMKIANKRIGKIR